MTDIIRQLDSVHRTVGSRQIPAGDGRTVLLRRSYPVPVDEVWTTITDPDRIGRWFLPVSGDLRQDGQFQVEGNISGTVLRCEAPRLFTVSWVLGGSPASEVEVRLAPEGDGTVLELEHAALVDERFWAEFGPGATGVGWDLALLSLHMHLSGEVIPIEDPATSQHSPEFTELAARSSRAWGAALAATGATSAEVTTAIEHTAALYAPPARMFATRSWMRASRAAFLRNFVSPTGVRT